MKLDQLEQFVIDHRNEFDNLEPNEELLKEFHAPKKQVFRLNNWKSILRIAAAILIFFLGFQLNDFISSQDAKKVFIANDEKIQMENDSLKVVFDELQFYYTSEINTVRNEIILLSGSDQEISNELDIQMEDFKQIFEELKNDLKDRANDDEVIEAMIQNYRVKLRLLEEMKAQLNNYQIEEEEVQYETIDI